MKRKYYFYVSLGVKALLILFLSLPLIAQSSPVPPTAVPPNGSNITAKVIEVEVIAAGSLQDVDTPLVTDKTIYSIKLKILSSAPLSPGLENFIVPGKEYEAFSYSALDSKLIGNKIAASLTLSGTTHRVRWWISNIRLGD